MAKLLLEFPDEVDKLLDHLADREGVDKAEIMRRALALYNFVQNTPTDKRRRLAVSDENNKLLKEIRLD